MPKTKDPDLAISTLLGQEQYGIPEFGIFVGKDKQWCQSITNHRIMGEIIEEWDEKWNVFKNVPGYNEFIKLSNSPKQYYHELIFNT